MRKELNRPNLLPEVSSSVGVIQKLYQVQLNIQLNTKKSKHNKYHGIMSHKSWRKCGIGITTRLEMVSPNFLNVTKTSDDFYEFVFWVSDFSKILFQIINFYIFLAVFWHLISIWIWMQITSTHQEITDADEHRAVAQSCVVFPPIVACCEWVSHQCYL